MNREGESGQPDGQGQLDRGPRRLPHRLPHATRLSAPKGAARVTGLPRDGVVRYTPGSGHALPRDGARPPAVLISGAKDAPRGHSTEVFQCLDLARWCFQHRRWVAAAWLLAMVAVVGVGKAAGTDFGSSFSLPNTDSQAAVSLLTHNFPSASGEGDQIVIQATDGATIRSAPVRAAVTAALAKVAAVPGVEAVASPYAKAGAAQVSRDGTVAFAVVTWDKQSAQVTTADANNLIKAAESADGAAVHISAQRAGNHQLRTARPGLHRRRRRDRGTGRAARRLRRGGARRAAPAAGRDRCAGPRQPRSSGCSATR